MDQEVKDTFNAFDAVADIAFRNHALLNVITEMCNREEGDCNKIKKLKQSILHTIITHLTVDKVDPT